MALCHTSSHLTEHNALFVSVAARHRTRRTALHPMGCAASSEAAVPVEIVPEVQRSQRGAPPTKPDALSPPPSSPATGTRRPSSAADVGSSVGAHLPAGAGGSPLTNSPQVVVDSVRWAWPSVMASGTVGEEDLKVHPCSFSTSTVTVCTTTAHPAGSQKQGINHCSSSPHTWSEHQQAELRVRRAGAVISRCHCHACLLLFACGAGTMLETLRSSA